MKIFVTGTRGIPGIPGGVEKHCEDLYPRIAAGGHTVHVCTRTCYVEKRLDSWNGVRLHHIYAPRKKSLEAVVHTFLAVLKARTVSPDVLHIHAIGPSLLVPLARLLGLKVVVTNHGPDYDRQKWGRVAKGLLRLGEKLGGMFAHEVIVISSVISDIILKRCGRGSTLIFNGVNFPLKSEKHPFLDSINVKPGKYVLTVARLVPEKGIHDLVQAFKNVPTDYRLIIAGGADHESEYTRSLREMASHDKRIIMTGYITGEPLNEVYTYAGLFVLPSYHEGLPIVLLEALSYDLSVVVSDIPANIQVSLPRDRFFKAGNVNDLSEKLTAFVGKKISREEIDRQRGMIREKYSWDRIAEQTIAVYRKAAGV